MEAVGADAVRFVVVVVVIVVRCCAMGLRAVRESKAYILFV